MLLMKSGERKQRRGWGPAKCLPVNARTAIIPSVKVERQPAEPAMVNFGMEEALRGLLAAADIAPPPPLYEANQGYLGAAPGGIDAKYAWTVAGGKGTNAWATAPCSEPAMARASSTPPRSVATPAPRRSSPARPPALRAWRSPTAAR
jgi:hypothetical protein